MMLFLSLSGRLGGDLESKVAEGLLDSEGGLGFFGNCSFFRIENS